MRRLIHRLPPRLRRAAVFVLAMPGPGAVLLIVALTLGPFPDAVLEKRFAESRRILSADGQVLREVVNSDGARATWTPLEEISPLVAQATIATEDARFFSHSGVDTVAVVRAAGQGLVAGRVVSGASTITMQLARLLRGHPRNLVGKVYQAVDALRLERATDKATILEHYLNRAPYGAGTVGVEAASQRFFGKPSRHLSLAEAALVSGLPQAPTSLNPLRHPDRARRRQRTVLGRMLAEGVINAEEHSRALAEPLVFRDRPAPLLAMHFTDEVLSLGPPPGDVRTTLDADLQVQVESLVADHVASLAPGGLTNAAVMVLDNSDCSVRAMVGSADYWKDDGGAVNGATALRQPGSTLKPFTYALAIDRGFTPASVLADVETRFDGGEGSLYAPRNYSENFSGPVLLGEALGRSLNVPAVRLANAVGVEDLLDLYRDIGFRSLEESADHYGLGLTLGNGEVTLLELAQAYAMLARGGTACTARVLAEVEETRSEPHRVLSEQTAFLISDVLGDEGLRIRAFGAATPLLLGFPMAVKTGTSSNWRDNWAVGYTSRVTVAVWAGDFEGRSMNQFSGSVGAGPLFHQVASLVVERGAVSPIPRRPEPPAGVESVVVCALSGLTPVSGCPSRRTVWTPSTGKAQPPCTWHRSLPVDRRNGLLASDRCPQRFVEHRVFEVLPPAFAAWQAEHGGAPPPTRYSPFCPANGLVADAVLITSPRADEVYLVEPGYDRRTQTLRLAAEVDPPVAKATWRVDGRDLVTVEWPYEATWQLQPGSHRLQLVAGDRSSDPVAVEVR